MLWLAPLTVSSANAGSTFLNGVNIDGVTNQTFEKATVRIDVAGNVLIDAPGYAAKVVGSAAAHPATSTAPSAASAPAAAAPAVLSRHYFLVTEQTARGMTDYDIDVYVNSRWIRKLYSGEEQIITDITRFLTAGRNLVTLSAKKLHAGTRKSFSPDHVFRVIIGTGNMGGDNVMIDVPVVKFVRSAAEDRDINEEFSFTTR